jgi:hypothetical protein
MYSSVLCHQNGWDPLFDLMARCELTYVRYGGVHNTVLQYNAPLTVRNGRGCGSRLRPDPCMKTRRFLMFRAKECGIWPNTILSFTHAILGQYSTVLA